MTERPIEQSPVSLQANGLSWFGLGIAFCAAAIVIFLRRPDAFTNPQFFAEDGRVWFADAYNHGWLASLFAPYNRYYHLCPRLAAALAMLVPIARAPLVMNSVGLIVQIWPVLLLLSSRMAPLGGLALRIVLACVYVALPNCWEVNVNVTCAQWHLAVVACLLLTASVPRTKMRQAGDIASYLLCGLSGPFSILLSPLALGVALIRRRRWFWVVFGTLAGCALMQLYCFVRYPVPRSHVPLGASPEWFARIVAADLFIAPLLGSNSQGLKLSAAIAFGVASLYIAILVWCFRLSNLELRIFYLFSVAIFAITLITPAIAPEATGTAWRILAASTGVHYWLLPTLSFGWGLLFLLLGQNRNQLSQIAGATLLFFMLIGFVRDWRHPAYEDLHFGSYLATFARAKPGEMVTIPENPRGWTLSLVKK